MKNFSLKNMEPLSRYHWENEVFSNIERNTESQDCSVLLDQIVRANMYI